MTESIPDHADDVDPTATMLADRALLRLSGEGVRDFLQGLVTQDVAGLDASGPRWSGLLTPQGKALFDFLLWDDGDAVLLDCEADARDALAKRLMLYRLRRPIAIDPADGAVHWSLAAGKGFPDPRLADLGWRWIGKAGPATSGWHGHRLEHGVTEGRIELGDGDTLWLECNAGELNGVRFDKGCYVGQENTARMHHRSKVNRRLVVAPIDAAASKGRAVHADLGLMIDLRRTDALGDAIIPGWLASALP